MALRLLLLLLRVMRGTAHQNRLRLLRRSALLLLLLPLANGVERISLFLRKRLQQLTIVPLIHALRGVEAWAARDEAQRHKPQRPDRRASVAGVPHEDRTSRRLV